MVFAQRLGRLADFALAGKKHRDIPGPRAGLLIDGVNNPGDQIALLVPRGRAIRSRLRRERHARRAGAQGGAIADFHGIQAP